MEGYTHTHTDSDQYSIVAFCKNATCVMARIIYYFYRKLFRLKEEGGRWVNRELFTCGTEFCRARGLEGIDHGPNDDYKQILSFGEDSKGESFLNTRIK